MKTQSKDTMTMDDDTNNPPLRDSPQWMVQSDLTICSFLNNHSTDGFVAPPTAIAENTGLSRSTVHKRINVLTNHNLVERTESAYGYYRLTGLGKGFLAGDLSESETAALENDN
jgi:DNA-binding MarR family transcriptional regulator